MRFNFFLICFISSTALLHSQQETFPAWEEGVLELHHIATGRGNATFSIFPDGTTVLIDAGDMSETHPRTLSDRTTPLTPNRKKSAPEWIVDYIDQFLPKNEPRQLDYALLTHYHDDHFGEMDSTRIKGTQGNYFLTGITAVGHLLPIKKMLDRGSTYPIDLKDPKIQSDLNKADDYGMIPTLKNYWNFITHHSNQNGLVHEPLVPGALNQIRLIKAPEKFANFRVRNIAVNGQVWTGEKEHYFSLYKKEVYPGENPLSSCIKISYGDFDYFTGGDISGVNAVGDSDLDTVESHLAPVVGPVDVATLNHHGNRDSQNTFYVRTLRPRVWIGQTWSSDHPDNNVLRRVLSEALYPGDRDLFATALLQPNISVIGSLTERYKSQQGHIVVRVYDSGKKYDIYVLNDQSEKREVKAKFGPYASR
jgi:beta-lactamase superfamily II metal-dependent hydrolase